MLEISVRDTQLSAGSRRRPCPFLRNIAAMTVTPTQPRRSKKAMISAAAVSLRARRAAGAWEGYRVAQRQRPMVPAEETRVATSCNASERVTGPEEVAGRRMAASEPSQQRLRPKVGRARPKVARARPKSRERDPRLAATDRSLFEGTRFLTKGHAHVGTQNTCQPRHTRACITLTQVD